MVVLNRYLHLLYTQFGICINPCFLGRDEYFLGRKINVVAAASIFPLSILMPKLRTLPISAENAVPYNVASMRYFVNHAGRRFMNPTTEHALINSRHWSDDFDSIAEQGFIEPKLRISPISPSSSNPNNEDTKY